MGALRPVSRSLAIAASNSSPRREIGRPSAAVSGATTPNKIEVQYFGLDWISTLDLGAVPAFAALRANAGPEPHATARLGANEHLTVVAFTNSRLEGQSPGGRFPAELTQAIYEGL